jgi:hypothetical protein
MPSAVLEAVKPNQDQLSRGKVYRSPGQRGEEHDSPVQASVAEDMKAYSSPGQRGGGQESPVQASVAEAMKA